MGWCQVMPGQRYYILPLRKPDLKDDMTAIPERQLAFSQIKAAPAVEALVVDLPGPFQICLEASPPGSPRLRLYGL